LATPKVDKMTPAADDHVDEKSMHVLEVLAQEHENREGTMT